MRPVLFHIGSFPVYSYSIFVALAYIASLAYSYYEAKRQNQDPIHAVDLSLTLFICGLLGSRLLFMITDYQRFLDDPREIYRFWNGGLVFYGGFIGAIVGCVTLIKLRGLKLGVWTDIFAPTGMLCLIFGRIGCLLNGCCYGRPAPDLPWGIVYPASHPALGLAQVPVHPTPVYSILASLIIFVILLFMMNKKRFDGQVFWTMALLYSIARFVIEFFRGDPRGTVPVIGLSTSQTISTATFIVSVTALILLGRRARAKAAGP